ncbi:uncharacterized protein LOC119665718 [Teleopsis dalmanni]|uniref:uncharacterized protein LOC119665718 n=1 Tax=Teleopsis dalmanni TaxID=139649 RepID=UPI0018CE6BDD|nr:uncharacterized protein LOC119665718 [Teleopsis dalmanni]
MAMARFINLERKLQANPSLKREYVEFMKEYLADGHMKKVSSKRQGKYYLPHQAVVRANSITTKVRVVFDASAKTTNKNSLNDVLYVGPRLQRDIFDILLKFRLKKFAIVADIEKMYRQIWVSKNDQKYQHILWRSEINQPIEEYKLTTVTYGIAPASFLAIRTLFEIANECQDNQISKIIKDDFYMDDLLTGGDTKEECKSVRLRISAHLEKYGFHLRKWCSNSMDIVETVEKSKDNEVIDIDKEESIKTLGLQWNPNNDIFMFKIAESRDVYITKRMALSYLGKIFDPLGLLAPVTVLVKLFVQKLWISNLDWDMKLNEEMMKEWKNIVQNLDAIQTIRIERWVGVTGNDEICLVGFADASEKAYAAIVSRVNEISSLIPSANWFYVRSKENPADLASRGIQPEKLENQSLWWRGPNWLNDDRMTWPKEQMAAKIINISKLREEDLFNQLIEKYSSFRKLSRVVVYIFRFIDRLRKAKSPEYLTVEEFRRADAAIFRSHQTTQFFTDISRLKNSCEIDHRNKMVNLNPFLDKNQVLRVGGRLINAKIGFDKKHPIIIAKGHLANLIINEAHRETLHGGHRLMENVIKRRYWIFGLKNLIKKCIRECVRCTRYKALKQKQLMGDLPEYRVNVSAPFAHCGVDYAGPLLIKCSKGRGQKTFKGYVAVFVCMATKALHLELVSDMTSDSFLAALKRLFARRGKCSHIYSDNGTNFVGASKKLDKDLQQAIKSNVSAVCALEAEGFEEGKAGDILQ